MSRDMPPFKARCSSLATVMTPLKGGITDKQQEELDILIKRDNDSRVEDSKVKPLTPNMKETMAGLIAKKNEPPRLSDGCISLLKKWYATTMYGDRQDEWSKFTAKGLIQEDTAIAMVEIVHNYPSLVKNEQFLENEWICGTPDIIVGCIRDTKCSFDSASFLESVENELSVTYHWQMQGYLWLTDLDEAFVDFCLVDTPAELTINKEAITYDHIPLQYRYHSKRVGREREIEQRVAERVAMCREWLNNYHMLNELRLGNQLILGGNDGKEEVSCFF